MMDTVKMSTKRNAKARLPYSPGQAAKTATATQDGGPSSHKPGTGGTDPGEAGYACGHHRG